VLFVTRHKLNHHLLQLPELIDRYAQHDAAFLDDSLAWLTAVEQTLLQLRNPLASQVATARSQVLATKDGYRDQELLAGTTNLRHAQRATAAIVLGRVEAAIRRVVDDLDTQLDGFREKMAQLLAVASRNTPIAIRQGQPREEWLRQIWSNIATTNETWGMYQYLNAAVPRSDLLALLGEVLDNLLASSEMEVTAATC
jgi:hypothetical protein